MDLTGEPSLPAALRSAYADWTWDPIWRNEAGGRTYRLTRGSDHRFVKLARRGAYPALDAEAERMRWAAGHLPVPEVIECGSSGRTCWLITRALPGRDATHPDASGDPGALVRTLARGLRAFHAAPAARCPFDFRLDAALEHVRRRIEEGRVDPERDFHPEHGGLSVDEAWARLRRTRPASEDPVVCHGDYCLPNILLDAGAVVGFVDLGELGVADRWWDLAVATWSLVWNLGPGYEDAFLRAYGVRRDDARVAFYRLLYDIAS